MRRRGTIKSDDTLYLHDGRVMKVECETNGNGDETLTGIDSEKPYASFHIESQAFFGSATVEGEYIDELRKFSLVVKGTSAIYGLIQSLRFVADELEDHMNHLDTSPKNEVTEEETDK